MDDQQLYGIGGWEGNTFDRLGNYQPGVSPAQQLADLHLPECPTKYKLLDQCEHCCSLYCYAATQLHRTMSPNMGFAFEEQRIMQTIPRSYAEVLGSSVERPLSTIQAIPEFPMYSTTSSQAQHQQHQNQQQQQQQRVQCLVPYQAQHLYQSGTPSWAEIAHDPNQGPVRQYEVHLQRNSSFLDSNFSNPTPPLRNVASQALDVSSSAPARRQRNSNSTVAGLVQQCPAPRMNSLPQQGGSHRSYPNHSGQPSGPITPQLGPSPHSIDRFVQQTTFGGHRHPSQNLSVPPRTSQPYSPASPSVASSRGSRASSRRTGKELRDPSYPFECLECLHRFPKMEDLRRHVNRAHTAISGRPHKCLEPDCIWAFVNPKDLLRHSVVHLQDPQKFECPIQLCRKKYGRKDNLQRHVIKEHADDSGYASMSRTTSSYTASSQPLLD